MLIRVPSGAIAVSDVEVPATVTVISVAVLVTSALVFFPLTNIDVSDVDDSFKALLIDVVSPLMMPVDVGIVDVVVVVVA